MVTAGGQPFFTSNSQWNCLDNRINLTEGLFEDSRALPDGKKGIGYLGIMLSGQGVISKLDFSPAFSWVNKTLNNHTVPGGNWWSKNWELMTKALTSLHSSDPLFVITTERADEFLMSLPHTIPGALHSHFTFATDAIVRGPSVFPHAQYIPLSQAIYHDFGLQIPPSSIRTMWVYTYNSRGLSEKDAAIAASLHQASVAVLYGMPLVTVLTYEDSSKENRKPVRNKYDGLQWLVYGEMLRPPRVVGEKRDIKLVRNGKVETWRVCPVLVSAWLSPKNEVGIGITNPYPETIKFNFIIDRKSFGMDSDQYILEVLYSNSLSDSLTLEKGSNMIRILLCLQVRWWFIAFVNLLARITGKEEVSTCKGNKNTDCISSKRATSFHG